MPFMEKLMENENEGNQLRSEDRDEDEAKATEKWSLAAKMQKVKNYLWDPEKREFLGRSGQSWSLILLFYLIFYAFLAGMFTLCMYTMLLTISPYIPTYRDRVSPPGVMIRPYTYSFVFNFNASERDTWGSYVDSLHHFLQAYNDSIQDEKNLDCPPGKYFIQEGAEDKEKKACQFKRSFLGNCSGLHDPTFGYSTGQPCVLLKMNRLTPDGLIGTLGQTLHFTFLCNIRRMDTMTLFPCLSKWSLSSCLQVNYTSPLVAVHFTEVKKNRAVAVECQLKGKNIQNNITNDRFVGRVLFTLNIGG
ncbi:protein ATP1B4 [Gracilinanus agilis]|uniref:protein ATP1B4 n=1 Tax=Gracilinanus agilis TaxID=191870 RepID=UPI001CFD2DEF|nr:protein ATP1B4 [Gracilinanus agilis]